MVSVLAFYSDDLSSIPAVDSLQFYCKIVVEKNENKQEKAMGWLIFKKYLSMSSINVICENDQSFKPKGIILGRQFYNISAWNFFQQPRTSFSLMFGPIKGSTNFTANKSSA